MASLAEQIASNLSLKTLFKAEDLKKRIWFTLGALLIYRFGSYLPVPGIDVAAMAKLTADYSGGLLGIFNRYVGGSLGRMSVFALGVMPYITASIIMQLMTVSVPAFEAMKKEGEMGRRKINQYTRYLTVALAIIQSYLAAIGLENAPQAVVIDPGVLFRITTVLSIVSGTLFLMWLGEQISARGIGNGVSILIFAGIVADIPFGIISVLELGRQQTLSLLGIFMIMALAIGLLVIIVFMERAQRLIPVQYPRRQVGMQMMEAQSSHLPMKLNSAGVIPPIFARTLLFLPSSVAFFALGPNSNEWVVWLMSYISRGGWGHAILLAVFIMTFSFIYTAIIFNPEETAENLKKNGSFIPGYRPGPATAGYLDYVLTRLTVIGSIYLAAVCVIPESIVLSYGLPVDISGTSVLILVGVSIDTFTQIQSHLLAHQYEFLMKKSRLRR